jgi:hypothetical protein
MRTPKRWAVRLAAAVVPALALVGLPTATAGGSDPATVPCGGFSSPRGVCLNTSLPVGGTSYNVDWYLPHAPARGLVLVQHGFTRGCGNLRNTSRSIMEQDLMVLCLNASMAGGNPALGHALADALAGGAVVPPQGRPLPGAIVVGGHSAGGHFASVVGARLAALGAPALRGALLFDPVADAGFTDNLTAISGGGARPVLAVAARPALANLYNNAFGALRSLPNPFVGLQLTWTGYVLGVPYGSSCHTDVEGENGDLVGNLASGCTPTSTNVARLREFASVWAADVATGARTAAYWCTDARVPSSCGSRVTALTGGSRPTAALIPVA